MSLKSFVLALGIALAGLSPGFSQAQDSVVGKWSTPVQWPFICIHAHLLPDNKVLCWGQGDATHIAAYVWNPAANTFQDVGNDTSNVFCSGHAFLPSGDLLVAGGHDVTHVGITDTNIFDWETKTWALTPHNMTDKRWYPTNTTLPNGEVLVVAGEMNGLNDANQLPQVWKVGGGWRNLSNALLWLPTYPWMHVAPNGKVFLSGPGRATRYLSTAGTGSWQMVGWTNEPGNRNYGSSAMFRPGKVLITGGKAVAVATAEVIDLNQPAPSWRKVTSMFYPRRHHNMVILPDGNILVTGGTQRENQKSYAVFTPEMWNVTAETWTKMADHKAVRIYHSTALLLADGRVLTTGGDASSGGINVYEVEIFSPPYLFKGTRPSITSVSTASPLYGALLKVNTNQAPQITQVTMLTPGSVTHAFNMTQRFIELQIESRTSTSVTVRMPAEGKLMPPGYQMLFILNGNGVPSVGKRIRLS